MGKGIVKLGGGQWAVKDGNLLAVKESNSRFLNTEFTVTRGTRATYVGRDGLMKDSNLQDSNLVLNGDFEELGSEIIPDGYFTNQAAADYWQINNSRATISLETGFMRLTYDSTVAQALYKNLILTSGKSYKVTFRAKGTANNKFGSIGDNNSIQDNAQYAVSNPNLTTNWQDYEFYVPVTSTLLRLYLTGSIQVGQTLDITNISVKQVDPNDRWTLSSEWSISDGKLKGLGSGAYGIVAQTISGITSKKLKLTFEISDYVTGTFRVSPDHRADGLDIRYSGNGTHEVYYEAAHETFKFQMQEFEGSIDNVSVQEIKTATPRVDFTDNTDGRLLLEPQRTNLITYSEDLNTSFPLQSGTVVDSTNNLAPDGINTAYEITSTGGGKLQSNSTPLSANTTYTLSFYAKNIDATEVNSRVYVSGSTSGGLTSVSYISQINTSTWTRIEHVFTTSSATTGYYLYLSSSLNSGGTVQVWGAQLEQGSYATSYIPTSGSTVTRAADTCSGAGTSQDFNSTEGVLFVEMALLSDEDNNKYISISDGTDDNKIHIDFDYSLSRLQYVVKNETDVQVNLKLPYTGTNMDKIAVKWKVNDFAVWLNGVEIGTDTSGLVPLGLNTLNFSSSGSNHFQGKIKQLQVYKEALNSTRLIHLTGELGTDFYESYAEMASALTYTIQ